MITFIVIVLFLGQWTQLLAAQVREKTGRSIPRSEIRRTDFANRSYTIPDRDPDRDPTFRPIAQLKGTDVKLINGTYERVNPVDQEWVRVMLHQVAYGNVTGDDREEALVALRVQTSGTQSWGVLYIYGSYQGKLGLLQAFWTGDRANEGLHRAYGERGSLAVEIYDPRDSNGDCCATRMFKLWLRWNGRKFMELERQSSPLPVSR